VHDLAARAGVPVEVLETPEERLPEAVEAAAYFLVSEALTNVIKYAEASGATIAIRVEDGTAVVEVADDGKGGAKPGGGSGLRGLADRVGALEGTLRIDSPPGQGTRLTARIPTTGPAAVRAPAAGLAGAAGNGSARVRSPRRGGLETHAVIFAVIMVILTFIWLTSGAGYFWPQWPLVAWGGILAIHAWAVRGLPAGGRRRRTASVRRVSAAPDTIGVIGAGTMGAGIAQLAARSGARTLLHDPDSAALERGLAGVRERLAREAAKGRASPAEAEAATARLEAAGTLGALAPCQLVVEAAPESLELKRDLFARLAEVVSPGCVLATNTSSLSVTAIAAAVPGPGRVVGMHFFKPAPVMRLLEVVAGDGSAEAALATARAAGQMMGKRVIDAADGPASW
jgi:hypothetical protein